MPIVIRNADIWGAPGDDAIAFGPSGIAAIGRGEVLERGDQEVDAQGGSVLPGFIDGHTHLVDSGLAESGFRLDVSGCSRDECLARVAAARRDRACAEWLVATGWDESRWTPSLRLNRCELDRVVPDRPAAAVRIDGHIAVLNSIGWRQVQALIADCPELADAATGEVREEAVDRVRGLARPDAATLDVALHAAARACHRLGITSAHVMSGQEDPSIIMAAARRLQLRLIVHPPVDRLGELTRQRLATGDGDDWARWGGVKLFADGSIGAQNAAMTTYARGGRGKLNYALPWLSARLGAADRAGWQTLVHAIGDRAIGQVLTAHRSANTDPSLRHRIEHFEFPRPEQVEETRQLGAFVCMQPNFIGNWSGPGGLYEMSLGAKRDSAGNPLRSVLDAGIPLGFGSDGMPLSPLYGVSSAVHAPHSGQRLSLREAVDAYTRGSAELSGGRPSSGRLVVGGLADLVLLDGRLEDHAIAGCSVRRTWVDGVCVFGEEESP